MPGQADNRSTPAGLVLSGSADRPPVAEQADELEPNDEFATAQPVAFEETIRITGEIDPHGEPFDRDIFDLGPAAVGDRLLADLEAAAGSDVLLGILDAQFHLLAHIDLTSYSTGPRQIDVVIPENTDRLYAVAATRSTAQEARSYTLRISLQRGLGELTQRPQVLVLNFDGARQVQVGNRNPVDVPPFDAALISERFTGYTETIAGLILERVRADFAGLNVAVYRSGDAAIPAGEYSTIHFGTYDARLLGLADSVDPYNANATQTAILYTDTFAVFNPLSPSVEQIAQALANTTSHEAGHLLGLRHTADPTDLMDTTATARQMLLDQSFGLANLNTSVLPVGMQNAPALLSWTVGGELIAPPDKSAARQRAIDSAGGADDFYIPREWLMDCSCDSCQYE